MEKQKTSSFKEKSKSNMKEEKITDLGAKIDETDEMKLKMLAALGKPESDDILYPAELNAHLIEQIKVNAIRVLPGCFQPSIKIE